MFKLFLQCSKTVRRCYSTVKEINISHITDSHYGSKIKIQGWVKSLRKMKDTLFFDVSDGSTDKKLQVVISQTNKPENLTTGASVVVSGLLNLAPNGQYELRADNVNVCGACVVSDGYPFAPKKTYQPEYIRQYLHLRPRTSNFSSLLRIRNSAILAIHDFFDSKEYINIHTPVLTSNDCEGAGEVFTVYPESAKVLKDMLKPGLMKEEAYFNSKVFLTVSGQLHLEAVVHGLGRVYTFGPTFRAENSKSRLHLSEFYMLEAETAFVDKLDELTDFIEMFIKSITKVLFHKHSNDIKINTFWLDRKFPVLTFDEAVSILKKHREVNISDGFSKEEELLLVKHCGNIPTFVINWPKNIKPFYMRDCDDDDTKVAALDLLVPIVGELAGGSLRENDYDKLKKKLPTSALNWYLDLRKFGGVPTGGFGLGFERYLQFVLGISNIKDVIPFPRWPHNCNL